MSNLDSETEAEVSGSETFGAGGGGGRSGLGSALLCCMELPITGSVY